MSKDGVLSRMPVEKRVKDLYLKWSQGPEIKKESRRWRIAFRGDQNTGKSHKGLTMIQDSVVARAEDDEYIKEFFSFNPKLKLEVLKAPLAKRRSKLRDAHMVVYLDFDNRGLQPLIASDVLDERLLPCLRYSAIHDWPSAMKAKNEAIEMLTEHSKKWGRMGCWIIIDNSAKAWSFCQSDYIRSVTGVGMNEMMADIKMSNPGQSSEARRQQAKQLSEIKDYTVISPSHNDEWLEPILNTGFHIMLMSPNKTRITEVKEGDVTYKREIFTIGGHPNNPYTMDYIIRLYKSDDGQTYYADIDKARHIGAVSDTITNPDFTAIRQLLQEKEQEYIAERKVKFNNISFDDDEDEGEPESNISLDHVIESTKFPTINVTGAANISPPSDTFEIEEEEEPIIVETEEETITPQASYDITEEFIKKGKKKELQEACDQYGLSTKGTKDELRKRLMDEYLNPQMHTLADYEKEAIEKGTHDIGDIKEDRKKEKDESLPDIDLDGW